MRAPPCVLFDCALSIHVGPPIKAALGAGKAIASKNISRGIYDIFGLASARSPPPLYNAGADGQIHAGSKQECGPSGDRGSAGYGPPLGYLLKSQTSR